MDMRIGIIPIPIYVILCALLAGFTYTGDIKGEISIMIAVLVIGGFTCAEVGKRTPVLRNIGAAAIFATFVPSALAYYKLLPPQIEKSVIEFTKYTNFLYLFIACIIVGSILGKAAIAGARNLSPMANSAQATRAILLASVTATTLNGRRSLASASATTLNGRSARSCATQGYFSGFCLAHRNTACAPTRMRLRYWSPCLEMGPSFCSARLRRRPIQAIHRALPRAHAATRDSLNFGEPTISPAMV
jgi:hypothetical protein